MFDISAAGDIDKTNVSNHKTKSHCFPIIGNALSNDGLYGYTNTYKQENSLTVTGRGEIGIAKARPYKYYPIVRLLTLKPKNNADLKYFECLINSHEILNESTGVPQLTTPQIGKLKYYIAGYDEQKLIGDFLSKIDARIETQNKIIKKYESLIKPLFDSLNKGPKHPVTIGELGKYVSADSLSWDSINDCGNPVIIYGQLFTDYKYIIREVISRTDAILKTVTHGNDLLFPSSTTVDALSLIAPASIKLHNVFLGGDMFKIEMDIAKFDSDYISFLINCSYKEELAKYAQGSTIIHLHYDDIKSFKINICDIEEQKKISNALNLLLDKITVEKRLLELLRIQRRYLLGNMFI